MSLPESFDTNLPWLDLRECSGDVLALTWGRNDQTNGSAEVSGWSALRTCCGRAQRRCDAVGWTFLDNDMGRRVQRLDAEHAAALAAAWNAIERCLPAWYARSPFACVRGLELLELPVGSLVASAHPHRIREGTLPFDSHPLLNLSGAEFARRLAKAPRPIPAQLSWLIADDLGQGAYLAKQTPYGQELHPSPEGLAEVLAFADWEARAIRAARHAGVRVVHGFSVEEFALEVLEPTRPFLMIAAHLEPSSSQTEGGVMCSDGLLRLGPLREALRAMKKPGEPPRLTSADLLLCYAAEQLADCFFAGGIVNTNSACSLIPSGKLLVLAVRLFERGLLDGNRCFQHAWAASTLPDPSGAVALEANQRRTD